MNLYDLNFETADGKYISFATLKGKVSLVVNTATACGFTPQLPVLQTIYERYRQTGFEVLAFPSNDFGNQEPMENPEILIHCSNDWGTTFQIFQKSHVKGIACNRIFEYLSKKELNHKWNAKPRWNFQKYLIDKNGNLVNFWLPFVKPDSRRIGRKIEKELKKEYIP